MAWTWFGAEPDHFQFEFAFGIGGPFTPYAGPLVGVRSLDYVPPSGAWFRIGAYDSGNVLIRTLSNVVQAI